MQFAGSLACCPGCPEVLTAAFVFGALGLALGGGLGLAARRFAPDPDALAVRVESLLPRIQCGQCGFPGCAPYAHAIAAGSAPIDRCPPGGEATVRALAALLGTSVAGGVDPDYASALGERIAYIDEGQCIGCTLCLDACPVDAIVGASRWMHTVIAADCTGCELCMAPCPVDCISMVEPPGKRGGTPSSPPGAGSVPTGPRARDRVAMVPRPQP